MARGADHREAGREGSAVMAATERDRMPAKPRRTEDRPPDGERLDKLGLTIDTVGKRDEETQSIAPLTAADRERLKPKPTAPTR